MLADRLPVTDQGVVIPKAWLGAATEVEVRRENGHITLAPLPQNESQASVPRAWDPDDPIWKWGSDPIDIDVTDASVNLDKYLYDDLGGSSK